MKNFLDYTDEKITEKAFMQSLVVSVVGILICIVSLCSITYAWFSGSVSSGNNVLKSGSFDLTVKAKEKVESSTEFELNRGTDGTWSYEFTPGTYTVTLTMTDTSTVKGYCAIIGINGTKQDPSINTSGINVEKNELEFTLVVAKNTKVQFSPRWGIASDAKIDSGCTVRIDEKDNVTITPKSATPGS